MPAVNPKFECEPCSKGHHAYCTMDDVCMCPNTWDGSGWQSIQDRIASKRHVTRLTTHPSEGLEHHPESGPLWAGRRIWICDDCRFKCKWWRGCERFKYCTDCERKHREIERRALAIQAKEQGARTTEDAFSARGGAGQDLQQSLPLPAHSGRKATDSPCDKKDSFSA